VEAGAKRREVDGVGGREVEAGGGRSGGRV